MPTLPLAATYKLLAEAAWLTTKAALLPTLNPLMMVEVALVAPEIVVVAAPVELIAKSPPLTVSLLDGFVVPMPTLPPSVIYTVREGYVPKLISPVLRAHIL